MRLLTIIIYFSLAIINIAVAFISAAEHAPFGPYAPASIVPPILTASLLFYMSKRGEIFHNLIAWLFIIYLIITIHFKHGLINRSGDETIGLAIVIFIYSDFAFLILSGFLYLISKMFKSSKKSVEPQQSTTYNSVVKNKNETALSIIGAIIILPILIKMIFM